MPGSPARPGPGGARILPDVADAGLNAAFRHVAHAPAARDVDTADDLAAAARLGLGPRTTALTVGCLTESFST